MARTYVPKSFFELKKSYKNGEVKQYDIVHLNRPESLLAFKPYPHQLSIFEIHGYDIGILARNHFTKRGARWKRIVAELIDTFITRKIIKKIHIVDIFYVSTPDLIEPIEKWCGRRPIWLPNPIDTSFFNPDTQPKALKGEPACFLAARLHSDKAPEIAIEIFQKHILSKHPQAVLHLIEAGEYLDKYRQLFAGDAHYEWHPFMNQYELAQTLRGSNLVFGDFTIGTLSLLSLQAMACKVPIITLDKHEILSDIKEEDFGKTAVRLLEDENFRNESVEKNYKYVLQKHSPRAIAEIHFKRINDLLAKKQETATF
jgi:glycosyltransferase involved in cell wall biosynthesis